MNLLSIETSCDETAISIMSFDENQTKNKEIEFEVLSNKVLSQINIHREFGGVFPNLAKREHSRNIVKIFTKCLKESNLYIEKETENLKNTEKIKLLLNKEEEMYLELVDLFKKIKKPNIKAIAVTSGPGLAPALWVGVNFAKAISIFWNIDIYEINHMEGHIVSALVFPLSEKKYILKNFESPAISLLISGGHTEIISFDKIGNYKKIGQTLDDAVGEAFDKVARSLSLPYPGGPEISKIAEKARKANIKIEKKYKLPRPMLFSKNLNFSFSGLKTAVMYKIKEMQNNKINENEIKDIISFDFENSVTEILLKKIKDAIEKTNAKSLLIGGGVIANKHIRETFTKFAKNEAFNLYIPQNFLTGDNAFMIGVIGILKILNNKKSQNAINIQAKSNWNVEDI